MKCLTGKGAKAKAKLPSLHFFEEEHLYIPNIFLSFLRSISPYAAKRVFVFVFVFFFDRLWENSVMEISTCLFSFLLYSWFINYSDQTVPCCDTTCFLPRNKLRLFWWINVLALHILCLLFYSEIFVIVVCLFIYHQFSSVQLLSRVRLFVTPWIAARQDSLSNTNSRSSSKLICIGLVMPSSHLILCRPLLLPGIPPSIRVFSNESTSNEVVKVLEFQPQHQSFQWTPRTAQLQKEIQSALSTLCLSYGFLV